ncbi:MAG: ATPase [Chloroflexi bacterium]|nr:MAG: ATPase [Chloroflexota bacterium]
MAKLERVKTGIPGLDEMLGGGFLPETANLVEGAPGTGKTTLGMQFIYNGIVKYNEPGIILTFEEFPQQYYADAAGFGWDFKDLERKGLLKIIMTSPEVSRRDIESVGGIIENYVTEMGARRIVVDSMTQFGRLTRDPVELRALEYNFINALKREGLTSVLTRESPVLLGEAPQDDSLGFVVDSYIILRYVEIESAIRKALLVLKMRGSDHAKDIRQFEITGKGFVVQSKFEGQEGILSGSPRRMADSFVKAFVNP